MQDILRTLPGDTGSALIGLRKEIDALQTKIAEVQNSVDNTQASIRAVDLAGMDKGAAGLAASITEQQNAITAAQRAIVDI